MLRKVRCEEIGEGEGAGGGVVDDGGGKDRDDRSGIEEGGSGGVAGTEALDRVDGSMLHGDESQTLSPESKALDPKL